MRYSIILWGIIAFSVPALAARYDVSLDPAQWTPLSVTGTYTKTTTPEGYLRVAISSYNGFVRLRSVGTFPFQEGATLRYKWRIYSPAGYYCATSDGPGDYYTLGRFMTLDHV